MGRIVQAQTAITNVTIDLSEDGATRLLGFLTGQDLALAPEIERVYRELADIVGVPDEQETPQMSATFPTIHMEIPRTWGWNVFELRSHVYMYLAEKGFEHLRRPGDIKVSFHDNQLSLGA